MSTEPSVSPSSPVSAQLVFQLSRLPPREAAEVLTHMSHGQINDVLRAMNPGVMRGIIEAYPAAQQQRLIEQLPADLMAQWTITSSYPPDTIGAMMRLPVGAVPETMRVRDAIGELRRLVNSHLVTYLYPIDRSGRLRGVVVLRDLFLANEERTLAEIMIKSAFSLPPELPALEAMKQVVARHYPVYPVCDANGRLVGLVRGEALFENQAVAISAIPGRMVGVRSQDGLRTPFWRSLRYRCPWLLTNLLLSLGSAAVVTYYRDAVQTLVMLAVFLPVVAAQARNSGAQTMAIALRGLTNGEWSNDAARQVLAKEIMLGLVTGLLVGATAGVIGWLQATHQHHPEPAGFGLVLALTMAVSCGFAGAAGLCVPLLLRRIGADPALASSIILSTVASVVSQSLFLGTAAWWLLK